MSAISAGADRAREKEKGTVMDKADGVCEIEKMAPAPGTFVVVPKPLRLEAGEDWQALPQQPVIAVRADADPTERYAAEVLQGDLRDYFAVEAEVSSDLAAATFVLGAIPDKARLGDLAKSERWKSLSAMPKVEGCRAEGYVIDWGGGRDNPADGADGVGGVREKILVLGTDPSGLLYGCFTLSQLLAKREGRLCLPHPLYVEDRPMMLERGRVGLARPIADAAYLKTLDEAARWRINVTYFGHPLTGKPGEKVGAPEAPAGMRETVAECHKRGMLVYGLVSMHGLLRRRERAVLVGNPDDAAYVEDLFEGLALGDADGFIFMFDDIPLYAPRDQLPGEHVGWCRLMKKVADRHGIKRLIFCPTPYGAWWNSSRANLDYHARFGAAEDLADLRTFFCPSTTKEIEAAKRAGLRNYVWWHNGVWDAGQGELRDYAEGVLQDLWAGVRRVEWAWYYGYEISPEMVNELRTIGERTRYIWVCGNGDATWCNYSWNPKEYDPDRSEAWVAEALFGRGAGAPYSTTIRHIREQAIALHKGKPTAEEFEASDATAQEALATLEKLIHQTERPGLWPLETRMEHRRKLEDGLRTLRRRALEPVVDSGSRLFVGSTQARLATRARGYPIRFTLDGARPGEDSALYDAPIPIDRTVTLAARAEAPPAFHVDAPLMMEKLVKAEPLSPPRTETLAPGLAYKYVEGMFNRVDEIDEGAEGRTGCVEDFTLEAAEREEWFALIFTGFIEAPRTGVYTFFVDSDDGSRLYVGDRAVVDNDGQHGPRERSGAIALEAGKHPIRLVYFQFGGEKSLALCWEGPDLPRQRIPAQALSHGPHRPPRPRPRE